MAANDKINAIDKAKLGALGMDPVKTESSDPELTKDDPKRSIIHEQDDTESIPQPPVSTGRNFLLFIAIDYYEKVIPGLTKLSNPVRDADQFLNVLLEKYDFAAAEADNKTDLRHQYPEKYPGNQFPKPIYIYTDTYIKCLYNEQAKRAAIINTIEDMRVEMKIDDHFIIYFAGHSLSRTMQTLELIPYDYDGTKGSAVDVKETYKDFEKENCKNQLLILDSCFAGTTLIGLGNTTGEPFSRMVLTSCSSIQPALDGIPLQGSPFSNLLIECLLQNKKNNINIYTVGQYLKENYTGNNQTIQFGHLPGSNGSTSFTFHLQNTDSPDIEDFIESILENLNFNNEKNIIETEINDDLYNDYVFISSVCDKSDFNSLQGNVAARELIKKIKLNQIRKFERIDYNEETLWESLAGNWNIDIKSVHIKDECIQYLLDNLLYDEIKSPYCISLSCAFMTEIEAEKIKLSCIELIRLLHKAKLEAGSQKLYAPLFIFIFDKRNARNHFSINSIEVITTEEKKLRCPFIVFNAQAPQQITLTRGQAESWHDKSILLKEKWKFNALRTYWIKEQFKDITHKNTVEFIRSAAKESGVNETKLVEILFPKNN